MPIGIQRLNAKRSQPNSNIIFIKPLPGANEKTAQTFLERIAAQCLPIMRRDHISVMTLEEYEPNREFVGRNFNAGEVVQLVLRSVRSGRWLPFSYVQMVMMHELAHCKQMNHSRAFWAVRNQYASQMEDLWREGYTGEGIWGRGANLATGEWERNTVQSGEEMLSEHLCGGTYRSRRRRRRSGKRKATAVLSYQERKQRRILKKFGENGVTLGADEETKVKLEKGKKVVAKPRVAGSARGRDLRAAAALARFEQQQKVEIKEDRDYAEAKTEEDQEDSSESDSGSEDEDGSSVDVAGSPAAIDVDGTRMLDRKGRRLIKVCEDDDDAAADANDSDARMELSQLQDMLNRHAKPGIAASGGTTSRPAIRIKDEPCSDDDDENPNANASMASIPPDRKTHKTDLPRIQKPSCSRVKSPSIKKEDEFRRFFSRPTTPTAHPKTATATATATATPPSVSTCSMCSFENDVVAATCGACAHVLNPALTPSTWRCASPGCRSTGYVNSGDCGLCGLCGQTR
ncbi:hypothetical protein E4U21_003116 [Claviceps maximensis]|nr:hypothetical protein E4U21_003116 [Claviceps maximensis]